MSAQKCHLNLDIKWDTELEISCCGCFNCGAIEDTTYSNAQNMPSKEAI